MKKIFAFLVLSSLTFCGIPKNFSEKTTLASKSNDTIRIANDSLEYEVIIIDPGFSSWAASMARPRQFYNQTYMEMRNRLWVQEWNNRAMMPTLYNAQLYQMPIDYQSNINYGYEVNYMLFNYLTYFQITNKQQFGGFNARF